MSTVKANNHQVGQSVTANQNFTLYQPTTPDGTVRLGVGNTGATTLDVLTATNAGNVTVNGTLTATSLSGTYTGTVAVANGGTGQTTYTNGQLLIGNTTGNTLTKATLTAGTGISVTNGTGSITIASTVTSLPGSQGQTFTSSGTFTIPSGVTAIKMTIVGGGGAGGTGATIVGSGGGGGGAAIKFLTGLTPGNTLTVTVGAAGGTSSVASGTQSITTVSATGGAAGVSIGAGGVGGVGSNGDLNIGGSSGGTVYYVNIGCNAIGLSGMGGSSIFGGGGTNSWTQAGNAAGAGRQYGGGGGGGNLNNTAGGAGAAGVVLIEW